MARKDEQKANANGHDSGGIKVRVIEFELNGRNATVSEGIKAITAAISGRTVIVPEPKRPALPALPKTEITATTLDADQPEEQEDAAEPATDEAEETPVVSGNGSGGQKRNYNYKTPTFLNALDLSKASKPLLEFIAEKKPTSVMDKYLVVVVWLTKHMSIEQVTIDHVYTIFDHLGWKGEMPVNPSAPLRDLKSKRHMLTRDDGEDGYKVNFKGEKEVENMGVKK
jgi:hypothetical protein